MPASVLRRSTAVGWLAMTALAPRAVAQGPSGSASRQGSPVAPAPANLVAPTRNTGSSSAVPASRSEALDLEVGEQRVIPSDNVQSYSEGSKGIVDVRLTRDASQFVVVGLREGNSTLLFLMNDGSERHYKITVTDPNTQKVQKKNRGTVEACDNIRLDFYFVQLNKNSGYQIGVGWPGSIAPTMSAAFDARAGMLDSATVVVSNQALPRLDIGQSSGWAKVMSQAAVVTVNGEKATFAGGGEVNVAIKSAMTTGIQKIPFGSQIEVEPQYDSQSGRIVLRLHADVSELDDDRGTGVPGRTTAAVDTVVNLEIGQSLVLGGLHSNSERSSRSGLPLLSQIPIVGALFGSHAHARAETQNVVIIVPSVVDAVSMQDRERLARALQRYVEYSGELKDGGAFIPDTKTVERKAPSARRIP
jgi:pilus assembly protein CpaC